ncbi:hypothetical protein EJ05DRAFT_503028 [Pseudovirgaria hyperparasitica]|uniref:Uncharacterized protein n=1 Tax=Pseudovirgaria hyperparasitica TaxID=470096 RepID=A0A6A6W3F8_9PEZI|nr:uncharacterized protein EJ05DRAFT_503028 [Pseudovirgaria hyperparasitica]KAF2755571.1 hypothetical protein EJ05DRAFT_503028 [Pseudovirgaria hyperparasitica]
MPCVCHSKKDQNGCYEGWSLCAGEALTIKSCELHCGFEVCLKGPPKKHKFGTPLKLRRHVANVHGLDLNSIGVRLDEDSIDADTGEKVSFRDAKASFASSRKARQKRRIQRAASRRLGRHLDGTNNPLALLEFQKLESHESFVPGKCQALDDVFWTMEAERKRKIIDRRQNKAAARARSRGVLPKRVPCHGPRKTGANTIKLTRPPPPSTPNDIAGLFEGLTVHDNKPNRGKYEPGSKFLKQKRVRAKRMTRSERQEAANLVRDMKTLNMGNSTGMKTEHITEHQSSLPMILE